MLQFHYTVGLYTCIIPAASHTTQVYSTSHVSLSLLILRGRSYLDDQVIYSYLNQGQIGRHRVCGEERGGEGVPRATR